MFPEERRLGGELGLCILTFLGFFLRSVGAGEWEVASGVKSVGWNAVAHGQVFIRASLLSSLLNGWLLGWSGMRAAPLVAVLLNGFPDIVRPTGVTEWHWRHRDRSE